MQNKRVNPTERLHSAKYVVSNNRASKFIKQKLIKPKRETDQLYISTNFSMIDTARRQ